MSCVAGMLMPLMSVAEKKERILERKIKKITRD